MTTPLPPTDPSAADTQLPGEAELAALYRQLPQSEPGAALDAAVLRAAARALENGSAPSITASHAATHARAEQPAAPDTIIRPIRPHESNARAQRRKTPRWIIGLSSAASLMLAAGLAWHMRSIPVSAPAYVDHALPEQATPASSSEARAFAPSVPVAARTPPPPQTVMPAAMDKAIAAKRMPPEYPPALQQASRQAAGSIATTTRNRVRASANAPSANAKPAPENLIAAKAQESYQAIPSPPPVVAEVSVSAAPAPAPAQPAPPAMAPASPPASPLIPQTVAPAAPSPGETPAQELSAIQQLFAQGKTGEARRRLLAFRHDHPQWPLPPVLQAQLPKP